MVSNMKHTVEVMIPEAEIKARIAELGRQITEHYKDSGSEMVLVGLLRGSFMFMADLCREVHVPHEVDFMTASSYGSGMSTTRDVKILKDLDEDIRGKDVLIVEDIIDSGNTLSKVREILSLREPKSLAICTLLDKPERREVQVPHEVDFMTASSYGSGMSTTRDVKILKDLDEDIRGKDVLIVEDIIDSGNTLSKVREILSLREPKSLAICTLLDKPERREVQVPVEFVGFSIPDEFVVGYGIDYAQRYRHLPYVGKVVILDE